MSYSFFFFLTETAAIIRKNTVLLGHITPCPGNQTNIIGDGTKKIIESHSLKDSQRAYFVLDYRTLLL